MNKVPSFPSKNGGIRRVLWVCADSHCILHAPISVSAGGVAVLEPPHAN